MPGFASTIAFAAIAFCVAVFPAAGATANRTWVSHSGLPGNTAANPPCNPQAPCDTFANALSVTAPGGEINCLDNGSYGSVTITQSVTIDCGDRLGGIDVSDSNAIIVNNASAVVTLRNLTISGNGVAGPLPSFGIGIQNAAAVTIENCVIRNFAGLNSGGVSAGSTNPVQLYVTDTLIVGVSGGGLSSAITVEPLGTGSIVFVFDRIRIENNMFRGIDVNGNVGSGAVKGFIRDSFVTGTTNTFAANTFAAINARTTANQSPVAISVYSTHVVGNTLGIGSDGNAVLILSNSTIQANGTALSSTNGGAIFTYRNNDINNNGSFGSAPTVIGEH